MPQRQDSTTGYSSATSMPNVNVNEPATAYGRTRSSGAPDAGSSTTQGIVADAKSTLSNVASNAGEKAVSRLDEQKSKAAEGLGSVAQALRQTSDQLRDQNQGANVHQYVTSAADQLQRLSGYLQSTNTREIVGNIEQFARNQPALFIGGAFVLGLIGARFLKSSAPPSYGASSGNYGYSSESDRLPSEYGNPEAFRATPGYASSGTTSMQPNRRTEEL